MPNYSKEWTENTLIIPENILLNFSKKDTELVRNWSKPKYQNAMPTISTDALI